MRQIVLIAHNIRSAHNIGSLFRTADGLGITYIYLTGYTPYPKHKDDTRIPHEAAKVTKLIHKTALGAEEIVSWLHEADPILVIHRLKSEGYTVCALEQVVHSINLRDFQSDSHIALLLGNEVSGIERSLLDYCDLVLEIPMLGQKESFNVVQAAAMALYHIQNEMV